MLYTFKKTILTGTILSLLSPWGLTQGQDLPDDSQTIHWNKLIPKPDDIANAHDFDLAYLLENYFSEYDGENFLECIRSADRQADREMRICDAASSHFDRDLCRKEVSRDYNDRVGVCRMVEKESQSSNSGCTQGGNQTHNEVNVRNSGNNNGNKTSSKPRRK